MANIDNLISNIIRADVQAIAAYHVPDSAGYVKLDAMENPYTLPEPLQLELGQRLADASLNRYPVPSYALLKQKICAKLGVPPGYDVLLGNGSDELISIIATACARQDRRASILAPIPAFVMFAHSARLAGMDFVGVPLTASFELDLPAMLAAIAKHQPAVVFLAYPNNPTANLFDANAMLAIIAAMGETGIVVVDEAYEPFAQTSFMPRLPALPNLVVMRTLSKLGLAGIRLGYMSAAPQLLQQFDKVRPPYNVNVLTQTAAEFALDHLDVLNAQAAALNAARGQLMADLATLPGVEVFPSAANFLLIRLPNADDVHAKLVTQKVLVKNVSKMHGILAGCLRITVSTPPENAVFLDAIRASLF